MPDKNTPKVSIIDYGMGNLFSVKKACEQAALDARITSGRKEILASDAAILPGVGAFGDAMANLRSLDLIGATKEFIASGRPFMAICLGMQLLMNDSEEMGHYEGLGIFKGKVVRFPAMDKEGKKIKIPQIGWNRIQKPDGLEGSWEDSYLKDSRDGSFLYFVHSYYTVPEDPRMILSVTEYNGVRYCSSIAWNNIFACQFHPEKSADEGIKIYRNFGLAVAKADNRTGE